MRFVQPNIDHLMYVNFSVWLFFSLYAMLFYDWDETLLNLMINQWSCLEIITYWCLAFRVHRFNRFDFAPIFHRDEDKNPDELRVCCASLITSKRSYFMLTSSVLYHSMNFFFFFGGGRCLVFLCGCSCGLVVHRRFYSDSFGITFTILQGQ